MSNARSRSQQGWLVASLGLAIIAVVACSGSEPGKPSDAGETGGGSNSCVASRVSGVAPLAVFFDASGITAPAITSKPFHDLGFAWDFGDAGSGTWNTGSMPGLSKNRATGPLGAHVYETPGTYTATLSVTDGTNVVTLICPQISVQDPEVVFAGANTICISTSGTPCTNSGAVQFTTSNFQTALAQAAPGKRLLFRRGELWTAGGGLGAPRLSANGPGIISAYDAGSPPLIRPAVPPPGTTMIFLSGPTTPNISDWRIMDLEFDGQGGASAVGVNGGGGAQQITLMRLRMRNVGSGISLSTTTLDGINLAGPPGGHLVYDQIAIVDNDIQDVNGTALFLQARRLSVLGNFVEDSTVGPAGEHIVRIQYVSKGVIHANDLGLPATAKHVLTLRGDDVGTGGVTSPNNTEFVVISENLLRGGLAGQAISIQPSSETTDQRIGNVILDGNIVRPGASLQTAIVSAADEVTVRNNIFHMTGALEFTCTMFQRRGIEPAHSEIRVYNNTCFTSSVSAGALRMVFLDATNTNVTIKNNLGYGPNLTGASALLTNFGSTGITGGSGTFGNSSNAQIAGVSPLFTNASGTFANASDFKLSAGSYAINSGVAVPVFVDFFRVNRPLGGAFDAGAAEQ